MNQPAASTDIRRDIVALLPRLRRFALTLSGSAPAADDLVGEVARQAVQKSHHWKGEGRLESWLFSMMRSAWANGAGKRRQTAVAGSEDCQAPNGGRKPSDTVLAMAPAMASALLLADVEGFAYGEAASILGMETSQFAAHLCAARLHLASGQAAVSERRA